MDKTEMDKTEIKNQKAEIDKFYRDSLTRLTDLITQIDNKLGDINIRHTQLTRRGIRKSNRENFHTNISSANQIEI